ncbi:MAG: hypothetical protein IT162_11565 [Bryobacterales bacterium]|nr:hypothetical protein [Bryobacterales bacterium]
MIRRRLLLLLCAALPAAAITCDFTAYKMTPGISAAQAGDDVRLLWTGAPGQELRAIFGVEAGVPRIRELAVRRAGGVWTIVGRTLIPEFHVTTGKRRISRQQLSPLEKLGRTDPEYLEQEKWKAFWDAPLRVPGNPNTNPGLPRDPGEIRRAAAEFRTGACSLKSDGLRLELNFDGLTLGLFTGGLRFTVYQGTNLIRQEAIAKTDEPSVAYKYDAGIRGLAIEPGRRVIWRDVARAWQKYEFGGSPNEGPVGLRARNRLAVAEGAAASLAVFPAPHKFFFAREIELNLGYVWYRKDDEKTFSVGVRQAENEEMYRPFGVSDEIWRKRSAQARNFAVGNFALYNAPPGTQQRMAVYYYVSPLNGAATADEVLKFTNADRYPALAGHQVAVGHFHTHFHEQVLDAGSLDFQPPWIPTFRALGINIAMMSDFHGDGHPDDHGPLRLPEQKAYFDACRRHSDKDFLIMPGEEPDAHLGGHYSAAFPKPVYWTHTRKPEQSFVEEHPQFGKVYHVGNAAEELEMLKAENGLVWQAHPRTKGSSGYPEALRNTPHFQSDRYLGASFQSLPVDLSEERLCEVRCLGTLDDMNNWGAASPRKFLVAEGDTYAKFPDDETYPHLMVNYVKLAKLPRFDEDWTPILQAMRAGEFFVSSGEVLIPEFQVTGQGAQRTVSATVQWTYPLEFVEVVWGDGAATGRKVVRATDKPAFGKFKFDIPVEAEGKKWVRFAAWDSAGNGAITQPVSF